MSKKIAALSAALLLAGCVTAQEANQAVQSRWVGQPGDAFFSAYGPPRTSFPLNDGSTLYTWRGGDVVVPLSSQPARPATTAPTFRPFGAQPARPDPLWSRSSSNTTVSTSQPDANTTVTQTTTRSSSVSLNMPALFAPVAAAPVAPRTETLYCEAQITVGPTGQITNFRTTTDTRGANFSLSRCAEVFGVNK